MSIPSDSVHVEIDNTAISLNVTGARLGDYHDVANALRQGRSVPATLSYELRWSGAIGGAESRDIQNRFIARSAETSATMVWRAETQELKIVANPSKSRFAAIGIERNGIFFT